MRVKSASQKGAAAVEFALILMPLLVLTFGLIEFGLLMYNQQVLTNATREGARYGIVMTDGKPENIIDTDMIEGVVRNYAATHLVTFSDDGKLTPKASGTCGPGTFGSSLTVSVTYEYTFLVVSNLIPGIDSTKELISQAVMRCE